MPILDPAFAPVADVFAEFGAGSQLVVHQHSRLVLDLAEGVDPDALVNVWSVGKPVVALPVLHLIQLGRLTAEDSVHQWWPEFPEDGTTVGHLLCHAAGRPNWPIATTVEQILDPSTSKDILGDLDPEWSPGTAVGEHAFTYGNLLEPVVRAVSGRSIGDYLRTVLLPGVDAFLGVPESELLRCADVTGLNPEFAAGLLPEFSWQEPTEVFHTEAVNSVAWRRGEVGAVGLHASARGLAGVYRDLMAGSLLDGPTLAQATTTRAGGHDRVLGRPVNWGYGFQVDENGWGMGGVGGSSAWVEPGHGIAFAFVTTRMAGWDRGTALEAAVLACAAG